MRPIRYLNRPAFFLLTALFFSILWDLSSSSFFILIALSLIPTFYIIVRCLYLFLKTQNTETDEKLELPELDTPEFLDYLKPSTHQDNTVEQVIIALTWSIFCLGFGLLQKMQTPRPLRQEEALELVSHHKNNKGSTILCLQTKSSNFLQKENKIYVHLHGSPPSTLDHYYEYTFKAKSIPNIPRNQFESYLKGNGFSHYTSISEQELKTGRTNHTRKQTINLSLIFNRIRQQIIDAIERETPLNERDQSLIEALCLGYRNEYFQEIRKDYSKNGTAHILAVSGFHLGLIALCLSFLLSLLFRQYRYKRLRNLLLIIFLILFTLLTGAAASTVRACLMSCIYLGYKCLNKTPDAIQSLLLSVFLLLLFQANLIFNIGFILSVSAVWGIICFYPLLKKALMPQQHLLRYIFQLLWISVAAQIGVFPWLLYFFGSFNFIFLWSGVPLVLLASIIIPLGLIFILAELIVPTLAEVLANPIHFFLDIMTKTSHFFAELPGTTLNLDIDIVVIVLYYSIVYYSYRHFIVRRSPYSRLNYERST